MTLSAKLPLLARWSRTRRLGVVGEILGQSDEADVDSNLVYLSKDATGQVRSAKRHVKGPLQGNKAVGSCAQSLGSPAHRAQKHLGAARLHSRLGLLLLASRLGN